MKQKLLPLLLACLMLSGCISNAAAENTSPILPSGEAPVRFTEEAGLYDPDSAVEAVTRGAVRAHPLYRGEGVGMRVFGEGLLIFTGEEVTALTLLSGEDLFVTATASLDILLPSHDASLRFHEGALSYFDPIRRETVILDEALDQVSCIRAPEDLSGSPILSRDQKKLYYCGSSAVWVWDLEAGIRRQIRQMPGLTPAIAGLYLDDTVLSCRVQGEEGVHTLFLDCETGQQLENVDTDIALHTNGNRYYAVLSAGCSQTLLFGESGAEPQALVPGDITADCFFLAQRHGAATVSAAEAGSITLEYYDLRTGRCSARLTLPTAHAPTDLVCGTDGAVYFLIYDRGYGCDTLYRWDPERSSVCESAFYTGTYYTEENPDLAGLAVCQELARQLSDKYGIRILIYEDAVAAQPWDYTLEKEYLVPVILHELEQLDIRLSHYPEGFLPTLAGRFEGLTLCLVRSITGATESGSLDYAAGLQFWEGYAATVCITAGTTSEQALYHELCHLIDTVVLTQSNAYDQWNRLNPEGFSYDHDYAANQNRDGSRYLQEETRSFIDTYSMSFEKEDRARIMEYAMTPGHEDLFQSPYTQAKLRQLCLGIREAFGLTKSSEDFLWEQYLHVPLAYME